MRSLRTWLESNGVVLGSLAALVVVGGFVYAGGAKALDFIGVGAEKPPSASPTPAVDTAAPSATMRSPSAETDTPSTALESEGLSDGTPSGADGTYYLADLSPRATEKEGRAGRCTSGCTGFHEGAAKIGASLFSKSYLMEVAPDGRRSTATWSLARACTGFSVTVGIADDTQTGGVVTFMVAADGTEVARATTGLADPRRLSFDVTGAATIELAAAAQSTDDDEDLDVVWGDAQVECTPGALDPR